MKNLLKIVSWVMMAALLLSYAAFASSADKNDPAIVASNAEGKVGETVDVTISLENNPGLVSMTLTVNYDSDYLKLVTVTDSGLLSGKTHKPELKSPYTLAWANDTATENIMVEGVLVTLSFEILDSAVAGESYAIDVSYDIDNWDIYDCNGEVVELAVVGGSVTVSGEEEQSPYGFAGYQVGKNAVRFIGYTNSLEYDSIDLAIYVEEVSKSFSKETTKVFKTLNGTIDGETKIVVSCDPTVEAPIMLDYEYLYGYAVEGIDVGSYTFTVVPTVTLNGETFTEEATVLTVTVAADGSVTVTK